MAALERAAMASVDEILADIRCLVEAESPSEDPALLDIVAAVVVELARDRLGSAAGIRRVETSGADAIIVDIQGRRDPTNSKVVLLGHYDTVFDAGTLASRPFSVVGDTVTGPGVYDMKGGLAQAIWSLRLLTELDFPHPSIQFLITGDEETGSLDSRHLVESVCSDAAATLVFEGAFDGGLKWSRSGLGIGHLTVTGVEAHSGINPADGASAVLALAATVVDLHQLTDLEKGTSVLVGVASGGTKRNIVPGHAQADIDVRVTSPDEGTRIEQALRTLVPTDSRVKFHLTFEWNRPPMPIGICVGLADRATHLATMLGIDLTGSHVGGGSDANFSAGLGIPTLDGLGSVGGGGHTVHEFITVSDLPARTALAAALISSLTTPVVK